MKKVEFTLEQLDQLDSALEFAIDELSYYLKSPSVELDYDDPDDIARLRAQPGQWQALRGLILQTEIRNDD